MMSNSMGQLMRALATTTTASYESADGTITADLSIYAGPISTQNEETMDGSTLTVRRRTFCIVKDADHADFPGLDAIQTRGKFTIGDLTWNIEDIRSETEYEISGTLVNVRERRKMAKGTLRR